MRKTALIFGATGQDGAYLSDLLLNKKYHVVGVARRVSTDNTQRLEGILKRDGFRLVAGDVTDPLCVYRILHAYAPNEVYNLAAQSHVGVSFTEPSHTFDVTAKGTLNILEVIRSLPPSRSATRFYQAGSSEMFGDAYSVFDGCPKTSERWQDEKTPFSPRSPYAVAKVAAHNLTKLYREAYGIFACNGILFNHESPLRGHDFVTRKISRWAARLHLAMKTWDVPSLLQNRPDLKLSLGNLDASRDWGYADDYVNAMWLMLQQEKADDYVVATGETHTVREFLDEASARIGLKDWRPFVTIDESLKRPAEVPYLKGDPSKARQKLDWRPSVSFKDLVELMVGADIRSVC